MNLVCLSLARYTFPNLPRPRGFPMSKSVSCQRRSLSLLLTELLLPAPVTGTFHSEAGLLGCARAVVCSAVLGGGGPIASEGAAEACFVSATRLLVGLSGALTLAVWLNFACFSAGCRAPHSAGRLVFNKPVAETFSCKNRFELCLGFCSTCFQAKLAHLVKCRISLVKLYRQHLSPAKLPGCAGADHKQSLRSMACTTYAALL